MLCPRVSESGKTEADEANPFEAIGFGYHCNLRCDHRRNLAWAIWVTVVADAPNRRLFGIWPQLCDRYFRILDTTARGVGGLSGRQRCSLYPD
jgi:hypothetical protein